MHSSILRGDDFEVTVDGRPVPHAEFFAGFERTSRLGVVSPSPLDGLGAAALVLAHVTAFYDHYRAGGGEFFAYPDFFTFQRSPTVARYGMLDVWPDRKNVRVGPEPDDLVDAITDRAVDTLLVADGRSQGVDLDPLRSAAVQRVVQDCYLYSADGQTSSADLVLRCPRDPVMEWMDRVAQTVAIPSPDASLEAGDPQRFEQSFRRVSPEEALRHL